MDPTVVLERIRALIEEYDEQGFAPEPRVDIADKIIENFENLDNWLSKGGFRPTYWK